MEPQSQWNTKMNQSYRSRTDTNSAAPPAPLAQYRESQNTRPRSDPDLESVINALAGIRYGQLVISIQDGQLIQIERLERYRMT